MSQNLSKNLLADLKMLMAVKVLEETLWVKSVFSDNFFKSLNDFLDIRLVKLSCFRSAVISLSSHVI